MHLIGILFRLWVMKRMLFAAIAIFLLILSSCHTLTEEERAERFILAGNRKSGEEAAGIYLEGLQEAETPSLYYNLAYSYLEAEDYEKAVETAEKAESLYPEYIRFSYLKAYAYRMDGRIWSYEKTLKGIIEKDPGNVTIRDMLIQHYLDTGRDNDARTLAEETILYDTDDSTALRALAKDSAFFSTIAPEESSEEERKERLWTEPPFIYMPLGIFNGDRDLTAP